MSSHISIHALLAESDYDTSSLMQCQVKFLSTLSLRRATINGLRHKWASFYFYPRSPCGERLSCAWSASKLADFYPRSPCGERLLGGLWVLSTRIFLSTLSLRRATFYPLEALVILTFLSTLSLRRATYLVRGQHPNWRISIHALLAESDVVHTVEFASLMLFLSTLSLRRAT